MISTEIQYQVPLYVAPNSLVNAAKIAGNGSEDYTVACRHDYWENAHELITDLIILVTVVVSDINEEFLK